MDTEYANAIGTAMYNFMYLEWCVIWTIFKLSPDGTKFEYSKLPAGKLHKELKKCISDARACLSTGLYKRLIEFAKQYHSAIAARNSIVHAHPYSTSSGAQRLLSRGVSLEIKTLHDMALAFENAAIEGNDIFHGDLKRERP